MIVVKRELITIVNIFLDTGFSNIRRVVKNYTLDENFNFEMCCLDSMILIEISPTVDWFEKFSYENYDIQPAFLEDKLICQCSRIDITGEFDRTSDIYRWNQSSTFFVNVSFTLRLQICLHLLLSLQNAR